eukprot:EG_transcript_14314
MSTLGYPLRGLLHFLAHPAMWCPVLLAVAVLVVLLLVSFPLLLTFAWRPQADFVASIGVNAVLSYILSVVLIIVETCLLLLIATGVLLASIQDRLFEQTLLQNGVSIPGFSSISVRRSLATTLWHAALNCVAFVLALPLNLIPGVGPLVFCLAMAVPVSWELHALYFDANAFPVGGQFKFVRSRLSEYVAFGLVAQLLALVPVLNLITLFTNSIGAALWVADLERDGRGVSSLQQSTAPTTSYLRMGEPVAQPDPAVGKEMLPVAKVVAT